MSLCIPTFLFAAENLLFSSINKNLDITVRSALPGFDLIECSRVISAPFSHFDEPENTLLCNQLNLSNRR